MSATNRNKNKRVESDFYPTPIKCIETFLNQYKLKHGDILEPSAGNGNIVKTLRNYNYTNHVTSIELKEEEINELKQYSNNVLHGDFLSIDFNKKYKTIIGNPPFSLAIEFIEKCLYLLEEDGELIFLLRTSFLESQKRHKFWKNYPLNGLYVLSSRPSFDGKGTDATSYAWFVWRKGDNTQEIKVI